MICPYCNTTITLSKPGHPSTSSGYYACRENKDHNFVYHSENYFYLNVTLGDYGRVTVDKRALGCTAYQVNNGDIIYKKEIEPFDYKDSKKVIQRYLKLIVFS